MIKKILGNRLFKNVSWIFFGNVMHSLLLFLLNIYAARKLTVADNGVINYGIAWITLFSGIASLGYGGLITKEFVKNKKETGDSLCSCILSSAGAGLLGIFLLQIVIRALNPGETMLHLVCLCQSTSLVFQSLGLFVYWYRYKNKANVAAIIRIGAFLISAIWRIIALNSEEPIMQYVFATAMETLFFGSIMAFVFFKEHKGSFRFSGKICKNILKHSYPFIFASMMITVYGQADRMMLKSMVDAESVALYSVSVNLAGALSAIPSSLIEAFRPDIMEYKESNERVYQIRFKQLYCIVFWTSIAYCVFISFFAKEVILLVYGEKYLGAVPALSLIVWYTSFSYFGAVNDMFMVSENKNKWVSVTTAIGGISNVIFNFLLIPVLGIAGAALASLITQVLAHFVLLYIIPDLRKCFFMLCKGVAFHEVLPEGIGVKIKNTLLKKG